MLIIARGDVDFGGSFPFGNTHMWSLAARLQGKPTLKNSCMQMNTETANTLSFRAMGTHLLRLP